VKLLPGELPTRSTTFSSPRKTIQERPPLLGVRQAPSPREPWGLTAYESRTVARQPKLPGRMWGSTCHLARIGFRDLQHRGAAEPRRHHSARPKRMHPDHGHLHVVTAGVPHLESAWSCHPSDKSGHASPSGTSPDRSSGDRSERCVRAARPGNFPPVEVMAFHAHAAYRAPVPACPTGAGSKFGL
jgi:hypothetical protein